MRPAIRYLAVGICLSLTWLVAPVQAENVDPAAVVFPGDRGPAKVNVSSYSKEIQASYKVFEAKCSKCHTPARAINVDKPAGEWKMCIKRMMLKPSANISKADGKAVYKFLTFWQGTKPKKNIQEPVLN